MVPKRARSYWRAMPKGSSPTCSRPAREAHPPPERESPSAAAMKSGAPAWAGAATPAIVLCLQETKVEDILFPARGLEALGYSAASNQRRSARLTTVSPPQSFANLPLRCEVGFERSASFGHAMGPAPGPIDEQKRAEFTAPWWMGGAVC